MTSQSDKEIIQGLKHIDRAQKYLKRNLFKWNINYSGAAEEFTKAGVIFLNASAFEECKNAYIRAADCYIKAGIELAVAGRSYEHAATACKELGNWDECFNMICKAAKIFCQEGAARTAIMTYMKGAKILETSIILDKASELYKLALQVAIGENDTREMSDLHSKIASIYIQLFRYFDAAYHLKKLLELALKNQNPNEIGRVVLNLVIVHLTRQDPVSAENAINYASKRNDEFMSSDICKTCVTLVGSYQRDENSDNLRNMSNTDHFIKGLDKEYLQLIPLLKTAREISRAALTSNANVQSSSSANQQSNITRPIDRNPATLPATLKEKSPEKDVKDKPFKRLTQQLQKRLSFHRESSLPKIKISLSGSSKKSGPLSPVSPVAKVTPKPVSSPPRYFVDPSCLIGDPTIPFHSHTPKSHSPPKSKNVTHTPVTPPSVSNINSSPSKEQISKATNISTKFPISSSTTDDVPTEQQKHSSKSVKTSRSTDSIVSCNVSPSRSDTGRIKSPRPFYRNVEDMPILQLSDFHCSFEKISRASLSRHASRSPPVRKSPTTQTSSENIESSGGDASDLSPSGQPLRPREVKTTEEGDCVTKFEDEKRSDHAASRSHASIEKLNRDTPYHHSITRSTNLSPLSKSSVPIIEFDDEEIFHEAPCTSQQYYSPTTSKQYCLPSPGSEIPNANLMVEEIPSLSSEMMRKDASASNISEEIPSSNSEARKSNSNLSSDSVEEGRPYHLK